jgi:hypothetical protein
MDEALREAIYRAAVEQLRTDQEYRLLESAVQSLPALLLEREHVGFDRLFMATGTRRYPDPSEVH